MRRLAIVLAVVALLAAAPGARAQSSPYAPLPQTPQDTTQPVVTQPTTDGGGGGLAGWQEALIFAAGIILIAGIGWAIVSDARERAPLREGELSGAPSGSRPGQSPRARRQARARAKAARAARRRNR